MAELAELTSESVSFSGARAPCSSPAQPSDFILLKVIGRGAFGKVLQVAHAASGRVYAMKVYSKRFLQEQSQVSYTLSEAAISARVRHPFIVPLRFAFQSRSRIFLISDYCAGGELFNALRKQGLLLEDAARVYLAELVLALEHLHARGVVHRDIKPENVLLDAEGHIAVTDFGLAKDFLGARARSEAATGWDEGWRTRSLVGTDEYLSPEMILSSRWWAAQHAAATAERAAKLTPPPLPPPQVSAAEMGGAGEGVRAGGATVGGCGNGAPGAVGADACGAPDAPADGAPAAAPPLPADGAPAPPALTPTAAPAQPLGPPYGHSVDFWGLGTLAFEMLTGACAPAAARSPHDLHPTLSPPHPPLLTFCPPGEPPFRDKNRKELYRKILTARPTFPGHLSAPCVSFIKQLLERDPCKRLGCAEPPAAGEEGAASPAPAVAGGARSRGKRGGGAPPPPPLYGAAGLRAHPFFAGVDWAAVGARALPPPFPVILSGATDVRHFDSAYTAEPLSLDLGCAQWSAGKTKKGKNVPAAAPAPAAPAQPSEFPAASPLLAGMRVVGGRGLSGGGCGGEGGSGPLPLPPELNLGASAGGEGGGRGLTITVPPAAPAPAPSPLPAALLHIDGFDFTCPVAAAECTEGAADGAWASSSAAAACGAADSPTRLRLSPPELAALLLKTSRSGRRAERAAAGFDTCGGGGGSGAEGSGSFSPTAESGFLVASPAAAGDGEESAPTRAAATLPPPAAAAPPQRIAKSAAATAATVAACAAATSLPHSPSDAPAAAATAPVEDSPSDAPAAAATAPPPPPAPPLTPLPPAPAPAAPAPLAAPRRWTGWARVNGAVEGRSAAAPPAAACGGAPPPPAPAAGARSPPAAANGPAVAADPTAPAAPGRTTWALLAAGRARPPAPAGGAAPQAAAAPVSAASAASQADPPTVAAAAESRLLVATGGGGDNTPACGDNTPVLTVALKPSKLSADAAEWKPSWAL
jgi:serine/threonine protein kinase